MQQIIGRVEREAVVLAVEPQHEQSPHDDEGGYDITGATDEASQAVELHHERRALAIFYLRALVHLAIFRGVAHALHLHHAVALDHGAASQHLLHGIGGIGVARAGHMRLARLGFAGERALVHTQLGTVQQRAVGRHAVAGVKEHHVAHHHVAARHDGHMAVAHHLHADVVVALVEQVKLLVGVHLHEKSHQGGEHDGRKDAHRLKKRLGALMQHKILIAGDAHREHQRHEQDFDEGIVKLGEELPPQRGARRRGEHIAAMKFAAALHLGVGQSFSASAALNARRRLSGRQAG